MASNVRVMSFNIKVGGNCEARHGAVVGTILKYSPDLLGIQEANGKWMDFLTAGLSDIYGHVYLGRDDLERGEGTPVFYKKELFELVSHGTKWLTDTPDTVSVVEGSRYTRIMTYAVLRDRRDGKQTVMVSTHLDYVSDPVALVQAKKLHGLCRELFGEDMPIFITGDFNMTPDTETVKYMTTDFALASAGDNDVISDPTPTNYGARIIIDYCFYSPKHATPTAYKVIEDKVDGEYPSDHWPLYADFAMN